MLRPFPPNGDRRAEQNPEFTPAAAVSFRYNVFNPGTSSDDTSVRVMNVDDTALPPTVLPESGWPFRYTPWFAPPPSCPDAAYHIVSVAPLPRDRESL
jgi:hypothetical protein